MVSRKIFLLKFGKKLLGARPGSADRDILSPEIIVC